jgi:hypothetical protein
MNEYGAMVERYWQAKTEVLGEKHYTACVVDKWMSMEQSWNDTDRGKLKYWEKNLSKWRFTQHKSHTGWPGIEPVPPLWQPSKHATVAIAVHKKLRVSHAEQPISIARNESLELQMVSADKYDYPLSH